MRSASIGLWMLAMTSCLAGCQLIPPTRTAATETAIVSQVCRAWVPITYSSKDTAQTVLEVRANNAAREAYCK